MGYNRHAPGVIASRNVELALVVILPVIKSDIPGVEHKLHVLNVSANDV